MSQLEIDYPDVNFVYMTGHANGTGEAGNLHLRNQQIRNYCIANNKVLYDFYDIECYDPDGRYFGDKLVNDNCDYDSDGDGSRDANWAIEWQNSHTEGVDWYNCSSAHSQPLNANRKAYAAWWMMARFAGWNPGGGPGDELAVDFGTYGAWHYDGTGWMSLAGWDPEGIIEWDSIRVLTRIMERSRQQIPEIDFAFAKRTRRAKKLCYRIAMAKGPNAQRNRHRFYKDLIKIAHEVLVMGKGCLKQMSKDPHLNTLPLFEQLDHYLTMSAVAIDQCERRVLNGEKVPASEKIVSIFEEHTDIIKRGKSQSPTEFGHKVLITTAKTGLITQYQVFRGNPDDAHMIPDILTNHQNQYGQAPQSLCGDRRFFSSDNEEKAYQAGVEKVSICKPGYRSKHRKHIEKQRWFKTLQRFRAGIEGIISALMRSYGLKRCIWKGWDSFQSYVGLSVVTFNLQKIAALI